MELRQLRYFTQVAEHLNFTEAARKLFISQSTLSEQVMQLERELGTPLFLRNGRQISLTEEGRVFYPHAKSCLQRAQEAATAIQELKEFNTGELRVGITFALRKIGIRAIMAFRKMYPHVKVKVDFGSSIQMMEKLKNNDIDMLVTFDVEVDPRVMEQKYLFDSRVCFVAPAGKAPAHKTSISLKEAARYGLIVQNAGFNTWAFIEAALQHTDIRLNVAMEVNDNQSVLELIRAGQGYGLMPDVLVEQEKGVVAIPLAGREMKRKVWAFTLKHAYQSKKLEAFYHIVKQSV